MAAEHNPPISSADPDATRRWLAWSHLVVERLPAPYPAVVLAAGAIVLVAQVSAHAQRDPGFANTQPLVLLRLFALPILTMYMLAMLRTLKQRAVKSLRDLRPAVQVPDSEYDRLVFNTVRISPRVEIALLGLSAVVVVVLLAVLRSGLPINSLPQLGRAYLSSDALIAALTLASYTLFGWAGLELVLATLQFGRGLGALAKRPLTINVFDPTNVLPFGSLTLMHSLSVAGVIIGLLITLGQPEFLIDYMVVVLASLTSIVALVAPLSGVRSQMLQAKMHALLHIHQRLVDCQAAMMALESHNPDTLKALSTATDNLINLRKTILAQPSLPFRNALSVSRVVLAALSPFVYFTLNELIRAYVLPVMINPNRP